jgi:hypothetical protein
MIPFNEGSNISTHQLQQGQFTMSRGQWSHGQLHTSPIPTMDGVRNKETRHPKQLYNIDDTTNRAGQVTHYVDLNVHTNNIHKEMRFLISEHRVQRRYPGVAMAGHL